MRKAAYIFGILFVILLMLIGIVSITQPETTTAPDRSVQVDPYEPLSL